MRLYGWTDLLKYKSAPKYPLSGPFHHSGVGRNPEVAGRFVAMISFLHTLVSRPRGDRPIHLSFSKGQATVIWGFHLALLRSAQGIPARDTSVPTPPLPALNIGMGLFGGT